MSRVMLIVGHTQHMAGAEGSLGDEWTINNKLVDDIMRQYKGPNTIGKKLRGTYEKLPAEVDKINPDFALEFHCNSYNTVATGTETLYCWRNKEAEEMAGIIQKHMVRCLDLIDRGTKRITLDDRGGHLLCNVHSCAIVIIEPFFLDNASDCARFEERYNEFVKAIINAIDEVCERLG